MKGTTPIIACLAAALLTATATAGAHEMTSEEQRTVPTDGLARIYVKNARGKTIILGRQHANEITIQADRFVRARSRSTAEKWMSELTFEVTREGDELSIESRYPEEVDRSGSVWSLFQSFRYRAYLDYTIEVPAAFGAKVSSASGDVQITSLGGDTEVFGSSGDVFLKDLGGDAFVEMSSGDVEIHHVTGAVTLRLSSGDALVRDVGDRLDLRATSGDVEVYDVGRSADIELASGDFLLQGCNGDVRAKTSSGDGTISRVGGSVSAVAASGDLYISILPVGDKEFRVHTASGDVNLTFETPEAYGFLLDVSTASGSIEGDLDIALDEVSRRVLRGVVGTGVGRVLIETASGDIRIQEKK